MIVVLVLGAIAGAGAFCALRGAIARPVPLARALADLDRLGITVADVPSDRRQRVGLLVGGWLVGRLGRRVVTDLAVVGRTAEQHAVEKMTGTLGLAGVALALSFALTLTGAALSPIVSFLLLIGAALSGFVFPDISVRGAAIRRRRALQQALSSYLDLVNVLLAGGAGIETALEAAAEAGDGWAFAQLRHALLRARGTRRSPWECFADLGERLGVTELIDVAATMRLAGEQGARVKLSLAAKAAALRAHQTARIEAEAHAATERMGLPTVFLFLGFMVLLGYPAVQQIAGSL